MAKKIYDSPQMRVCMLDCQDAITTSNGKWYEADKTVVGSFIKDWSQFFDDNK